MTPTQPNGKREGMAMGQEGTGQLPGSQGSYLLSPHLEACRPAIPYYLETDTSGAAMGAVLGQRPEDGTQ